MKYDPDDYRVKPGTMVDLSAYATRYEGKLEKEEALVEFERLGEKINELQERLYAEGKRSLLAVFQAMDAAGKDSTIRAVFSPINPEGINVVSFKAPSALELSHDFLWRAHAQTPRRGLLTVWNRSHYEDVLIVRVKKLAPLELIKKRYAHINAFERMLADEGTRVVKFFLHIGKDYQKEQLQERLDDPGKLWKFSPDDLPERACWDDYQKAFVHALSECSTKEAPWYVVPAERKWFRNLLVSRVVCDILESMDPRFPKAGFDPKSIVIE